MTVNIHDTDVLGGNKDAKALDEYIKRLEKQKGERLTEKQVHSLMQIAKVLRNNLSQN